MCGNNNNNNNIINLNYNFGYIEKNRNKIESDFGKFDFLYAFSIMMQKKLEFEFTKSVPNSRISDQKR